MDLLKKARVLEEGVMEDVADAARARNAPPRRT